jgi:EAL domain-containing protein (putative c-di-GMP-specific phosphodiesterase class I)
VGSNGRCGGSCACRAVPDWRDEGRLVVHSRTGHTLRLVARTARDVGADAWVEGPTCRITGDLDRVLEALGATLSGTEQVEARAVIFEPDVGDPLVTGLGAVTLGELVGRRRHRHLAALLADPSRFHARYQPIVDVATAEVVAYEALLRATADDGTEIGAAGLFPPAAATGVTHTLDRIGRETAIRDAAPFIGDLRLFINFVPTSIYRPELCLATTEAAARQHGIALERIVFEVTETERVQDTAHLLDIVRHYRERGARVALDDVGSGYASLELVQLLRPDVVKIDRGIVSRLPGEGSRAVVAALVAVGREIGATVLAEGVETAQEADAARQLGVDLAQGWFFGRPERAPAVPSGQRVVATA